MIDVNERVLIKVKEVLIKTGVYKSCKKQDVMRLIFLFIFENLPEQVGQYSVKCYILFSLEHLLRGICGDLLVAFSFDMF